MESLLLRALSSPTTCQFIPALSVTWLSSPGCLYLVLSFGLAALVLAAYFFGEFKTRLQSRRLATRALAAEVEV
jgi:hypothetical protein